MLPALLIPAAIKMATAFAPSLIGKLMGDKAEEVATKVIDIGKSVTGKDDPDEILSEIEGNPEMAARVKEAMYEYRIVLEQEETKRLQAHVEQMGQVNQTMQTEIIHGKGLKSGWRPYNGYLFGTTIFFDYFVSQIVLAFMSKVPAGVDFSKMSAEVAGKVLAANAFEWVHIPEPIYVMWAMVLGVSAASRGVEKVKSSGGVMSAVAGLIGKGK